jgi:hypothetical protein
MPGHVRGRPIGHRTRSGPGQRQTRATAGQGPPGARARGPGGPAAAERHEGRRGRGHGSQAEQQGWSTGRRRPGVAMARRGREPRGQGRVRRARPARPARGDARERDGGEGLRRAVTRAARARAHGRRRRQREGERRWALTRGSREGAAVQWPVEAAWRRAPAGRVTGTRGGRRWEAGGWGRRRTGEADEGPAGRGGQGGGVGP